MWVLVLFVGLTGGQPSSVPGYRTEQICNDAGKEYAKRAMHKLDKVTGHICIPGPGQTEPTSAGWAGGLDQ